MLDSELYELQDMLELLTSVLDNQSGLKINDVNLYADNPGINCYNRVYKHYTWYYANGKLLTKYQWGAYSYKIDLSSGYVLELINNTWYSQPDLTYVHRKIREIKDEVILLLNYNILELGPLLVEVE